MKNFKIVYLDVEKNKTSEIIKCYSIHSAKTTFMKKHKGQYSEILYIFSLGKETYSQWGCVSKSYASFVLQKATLKHFQNK